VEASPTLEKIIEPTIGEGEEDKIVHGAETTSISYSMN